MAVDEKKFAGFLAYMIEHITKMENSLSCVKGCIRGLEQSSTHDWEFLPIKTSPELNYKCSDPLDMLLEGMTHDLYRIVSSMLGNISQARNSLRYKKDELSSESLSMAEKSCKEMKELFEQLCIFAASRPCPEKILPISRIIKKGVEYALRHSNSTCGFDLPNDLWPVRVDEEKLLRAIDILIKNCRTYGGKINVSAKNLFNSETRSKQVELEILNEVPGAEPSSEIHDVRGLGFALCRLAIQEHLGCILANTKTGRCSAITIRLPADFGPELVKADTNGFSQGKVIIATNEEAYRDSAGLVLNYLGYEPIVMRSMRESIHYLKENGSDNSRLPMLLLDSAVEGKGEPLPDILQRTAHTYAFVSTDRDINEPELKKLGFIAILKKPLSISEIREKMMQGANPEA